MKRFAIGLIIAVLGIAALASVAFTSGIGSPSLQEADTEIQQGWLGIRIAGINERIRYHFHLTVESGVVVIEVRPENPAQAAGLRPGDVIQAIDAQPVESVDQVIHTIQALAPGTVVTLTVLRGQEQLSIEATLGARPEPLIPPYLGGLLSQGLLPTLLHADYQLLGPDDTVISVGLTMGEVQSVGDTGLLAVVRKDNQVADFQTTADTKVIVGRHAINLAGLMEGTPVLVVEKDQAVTLVIGWPGDMLPHSKPPQHKTMGRHAYPIKPAISSFGAPDIGSVRGLNPESLERWLGNGVPGPEVRERLQRTLGEWRGGVGAPLIQPEKPGTDVTL